MHSHKKTRKKGRKEKERERDTVAYILNDKVRRERMKANWFIGLEKI